jgi:hypothetical protein
MLWVISPMYDSAKVLYELLIHPLSDAEREQLWRGYIQFGELFGMSREVAPPTTAGLDAWWEPQLSGERVFLTPAARAVGRSIGFKLPVPSWARPAMRAAGLILRGSLPAQVREQYRLSWSPGDQLAFQMLARAHRTVAPLVATPLRRGSTMPLYNLIAHAKRETRHKWALERPPVACLTRSAWETRHKWALERPPVACLTRSVWETRHRWALERPPVACLTRSAWETRHKWAPQPSMRAVSGRATAPR